MTRTTKTLTPKGTASTFLKAKSQSLIRNPIEESRKNQSTITQNPELVVSPKTKEHASPKKKKNNC